MDVATNALYSCLDCPPPWTDPAPLAFDHAGREVPYGYSLHWGHYSSCHSCSGCNCQGWTNYYTLSYICAQSTFFNLLTFTIKTLTSWWLQEITFSIVKHTFSIFSRPISICTLGFSVSRMILTTWQFFWLPFLDLFNTYTDIIHTMIPWNYLPGLLLCQQSPTTTNHTKNWCDVLFSHWNPDQTNMGSFQATVQLSWKTCRHLC